MLERAQQQLENADSAALIELLAQEQDAVTVARCYADLLLHSYNVLNDATRMILLARAGIHYALSAAQTAPADESNELRGIAKGIAYNLASFTWPGWDEPGIELDGTARRTGLDAAHTNLRLAHELGRGEVPLSRARWVLGAQQMANGDLAGARENFAEAATLAQAADAEGESLLSQAFAMQCERLQSPADTGLQRRYEALKAQLATQEHGDFFCQQLDTAWAVFQPAPT